MVLSSHFKKIYILGIFASLVILLTLAVLWVYDARRANKTLSHFNDEFELVQLISTMRNAAYKQTLDLHQMTHVNDLKERNNFYGRSLLHGKRFVDARNKFLAHDLSDLQIQSWQRISQNIDRAAKLHRQVADLVFTGKYLQAQKLMVNKIDPLQKVFFLEMDTMIGLSKSEVAQQINQSKKRSQTTYITIFVLSTISLLMALVNLLFFRRTTNTEQQLMEQGERIRALYEVSARSDLSYDEKITETLKVGCRLLGMEIGKVGKLDVPLNQSIFLNNVSPPDLPLKRGTIMPLDKTYCNITFNSDKPVAINHVGKSMYRTEPCYKFLGMEAYIGTTIRVHGKIFGTVHFSSRKPREPFRDTDLDLINLMGSWVAVSLERKFAQEELEKSKETAEKANKFKSQFLANMSHEIRTPLTAIIGYSEFLRDDGVLDKEERKTTIETIIRSGQHLHQIINDILDISKIEAGELKIELLPVSPFHIILDIQNQLRKQLTEKGLLFNTNFHFPLPKTFLSDPTRLKQILINLCNNAIKFTEQGGIDLDVSYANELDCPTIIIDVTDSGIGMTEEEQKHVMNPFAQADSSTTRKYGGTGLGLSISRQLCERLNGSLNLRSEPGKGSRFTIKLKLSEDPTELVYEFNNEKQCFPDNSLNFDGKQAHVLLAEDNVDNQNLIALFLRKANVVLDIADNGQEALEMVDKKNYDLVLMDIQMPVIDGKQAIKELRSKGFTNPIITITANTLHEDLKSYKQMGANDVIAKPISSKDFYEKISKYLESSPSNKRNVS